MTFRPDTTHLPGEVLDTLIDTQYSGVEDRRRLVLRSDHSWEEFWEAHSKKESPSPDAPPVDFGRTMVIAVSMGGRATGGYTIEIADVLRTKEKLQIVVRENSPGKSCVVSTGTTDPVFALLIGKTNRPIEFLETRAVRGCS